MALHLQIIPKVYKDLDRIYNQIASFVSESSADAIINDIYELLELATENPEMGAIGLVEDTRELFPRNGKYRVVYQFDEESLYVLKVALTKQKYPSDDILFI